MYTSIYLIKNTRNRHYIYGLYEFFFCYVMFVRPYSLRFLRASTSANNTFFLINSLNSHIFFCEVIISNIIFRFLHVDRHWKRVEGGGEKITRKSSFSQTPFEDDPDTVGARVAKFSVFFFSLFSYFAPQRGSRPTVAPRYLNAFVGRRSVAIHRHCHSRRFFPDERRCPPDCHPAARTGIVSSHPEKRAGRWNAIRKRSRDLIISGQIVFIYHRACQKISNDNDFNVLITATWQRFIA